MGVFDMEGKTPQGILENYPDVIIPDDKKICG
jgi:hypothetical protein